MANVFDKHLMFLDDWWGSTARKLLSPAGRQAYLELLWFQYSMGSRQASRIPSRIAADDEAVAKHIGFTLSEWKDVKAEVLEFLELDDEGRLYHPKVEKDIRYVLGKIAGGKARQRKGKQKGQQKGQQQGYSPSPS